MSKKEQLRQQLLENTLGKNAKNRSLSSFGKDLQELLNFQSAQLKELSSHVDEETLNKINAEMEKDFGVKLNENAEIRSVKNNSIDEIKKELILKWKDENNITSFLSFIEKTQFMERKESSILFYNCENWEEILKDITRNLYENQHLSSYDMKVIDFTSYPNKNEVFYQDMYDGLYGENSILVLDHIEELPKMFLPSLISLLKEKEIRLMNRYIQEKGALKEIGSTLVKDALSSLIWENKMILLLCYKDIEDLSDVFGNSFIEAIDEIKEYIPLSLEIKNEIWESKIAYLKTKLETKYTIEGYENLVSYIQIHKMKEVDAFLEDVFSTILEMNASEKIEISLKENTLYFSQKEVQKVFGNKEFANFDKIDKELQSLIGLSDVKEYLISLKNYYITMQKRKAQGKKTADVSKHMIFSGNPGTGKTTVARILAQYLKASGILKSGHLIEVTRKDLVGQYVGHTAVQTSQVIQSALGGVLFIDEAYSLYRGSQDSYGLEAIDTIVKYMEDYRDEFVVVLAGYKKEMEEFLSANSGLRSRFPNTIEFKDYTGEELYRIACSIAKSKDYSIDENAKDTLISYLNVVNTKEGGNGRLARNMVEKAMISHSMRGSEEDVLLLEDFIKKGCENIE